MNSPFLKKLSAAAVAVLLLWLSARYLLPIAMPFLLGTALALAAEPLVHFFQSRCRMRRFLATALGVTVTLCLAALLVLMLAAFLLRELRSLAGIIPDLEGTALSGMSLLQDWLLSTALSAPASLQPLLQRFVEGLFSGSTALLDELTSRLLGTASAVLSRLPDSALGLGTMVIAAYMISGKLPELRPRLREKLPKSWHDRYLPALRKLRSSLGGWFRAQLKLICITFLLLTGGFLILQISHGPLWAAVIALVDAVPILGTGTVLVPWAVVSLLQGDHIRFIGLLCIFAVASLTRSVMEPRLVGKQLGLDPLLTLASMYAGYKLFGIGGLVFAPLVAVCAVSLGRLKL